MGGLGALGPGDAATVGASRSLQSLQQPAGSELGGRRGLCSRSSLAEVLSFPYALTSPHHLQEAFQMCLCLSPLPAASPPDFSFHHLSFQDT